MFGRNGKAELYISSFLTILWIVTTWFNTTIRLDSDVRLLWFLCLLYLK